MSVTITCTTCSDVIYEGSVPACFELADNLLCQDCSMALEWFDDMLFEYRRESNA